MIALVFIIMSEVKTLDNQTNKRWASWSKFSNKNQTRLCSLHHTVIFIVY